jgi:hypothetical protein
MYNNLCICSGGGCGQKGGIDVNSDFYNILAEMSIRIGFVECWEGETKL